MRVAILGPICRDIVTIDGEAFEQMGSPAFYIGNALASFGAEVTAFVTYGKNDDEWVQKNFHGVKIIRIPAEGTLEFNNIYSRSSPDLGRKEVTYYKNTILPESIASHDFAGFDYVIFGPLLHDNTPKELFSFLSHKKIILGNFGMFAYPGKAGLEHRNPENMLGVLRHVDYLFLSEEEVKFVSGKADVFEAGWFLQAKGAKNVIATRGSKGSLLFTGKRCFFTPAFAPDKLVDIIGAGDTYQAGFIRALELFKEPQKQIEFASMCATMKIEKRGPLTASVEEVLSRLRQH